MARIPIYATASLNLITWVLRLKCWFSSHQLYILVIRIIYMYFDFYCNIKEHIILMTIWLSLLLIHCRWALHVGGNQYYIIGDIHEKAWLQIGWFCFWFWFNDELERVVSLHITDRVRWRHVTPPGFSGQSQLILIFM